jgi:hypothetical protein
MMVYKLVMIYSNEIKLFFHSAIDCGNLFSYFYINHEK